MSKAPVYLLMITYEREQSALEIIEQYINCDKPSVKTNFIVIENSPEQKLNSLINFVELKDIHYFYYDNKNKAAAINYAIANLIAENEALIIAIDNDIVFQKNYLLKYYHSALKMGNSFYFGSSFHVNVPSVVEQNLIPYLSGSALGQSDAQFKKMEKLMFLGFSYAFFKSQWEKVGGLDERFSPGSKYDLAAEESIFQKKLKRAGFIPFFIENNSVEHRTDLKLYHIKNVLYRQEQNGYTHAFQNIIKSDKFLKFDYFKQLVGLLKRCIILLFNENSLKLKMKWAYTKGYFKGFLLYLKIDNKTTYLKN